MTATVTSVYRRAADILDSRGWNQGDLIDPENGAVCVLGACLLASGIVPDITLPFYQQSIAAGCRRHAAVLAAHLGGPLWMAVHTVTEWNDTDDRTVDDVRRLLHAAADIDEVLAAVSTPPIPAPDEPALAEPPRRRRRPLGLIRALAGGRR